MAFNGSGVFSRLYNWVTEQASSPIEIAKLDTQEEDFATALSNCILRDGTGVPSQHTPWNSKRITGLADPSSAQDAATKAYVDTNGTQVVTVVGFATPPSYTVRYAKHGNAVTLFFPAVTGTADSVLFTFDALPVAIRPTREQKVSCPANNFIDAGVAAGGVDAIIPTSGVVGLYRASGGAWTASGTRTISYGFAMTYFLA